MKHPRLWCRNGIYYFRCKVPKDLLIQYHGRKLIQRSLNTHDPREAKRLVILESAKQEEEFARTPREYDILATTLERCPPANQNY